MAKKTYSDKLLDPRWQKKRLKIFERDNWSCVCCADSSSTLSVHHKSYNVNPWNVENDQLMTLCVLCHKLYEQAKKISDFNGQVKFRINDNGFKSYLLGVNRTDTFNEKSCISILVGENDTFIMPEVVYTEDYLNFIKSFLSNNDDQDKVLEQYPSARLKYSIMMSGATVPFSFGDTESSAWRNARIIVLNNKSI